MRKTMYFVIFLVVATMLACGFNVSTANISEAKMTKDADGQQATSVFAQDDAFYAVVKVANAPDDTKVKAIWIAVAADGVDPNFVIGEKELEGGGTLTFSLSNAEDQLWPAGKYKVDLYLNDELDRSLEFNVEGEAVAEEPTPEPTDTPEPTPTPEPTDTPEPAATPTKPAIGESSDSVGDTIAKSTETPAEEAEPLPFQEEPYVHPSGAFTFGLPEGWEVSSEDDTGVTVRSVDTIANFSSMFMDAGRTLDQAEMEEFSEQLVEAFTGGEAYEVLASDQDEGNVYVQVAFELVGVDVIADFFFVQQDTVLYVLNFIATDYEAMQPTWFALIDTYDTDVAAAKAAAPASSPAPADTPTPVPLPPTPTEPPPPSGPSIPAGKGALIMLNCRGDVINVDVIPAGIFQELGPKTGEDCKAGDPLFLDPGEYILKASIAGVPSKGEATINILEGQVLTFTWQ
ncbi:MAG: hypothetical protein JW953_16360 [Anaerolineae bacterium]|nr:hypothetical protein [Anaerolineae bacterium]